MKKVLALVLAVIMVCTMAMAAPVSVTVTPIGGASADGQIKLTSEDLTKTYGVEIPAEYYPDTFFGTDLSKITFEGSNVQLSNGSFYLIVPVADKPLDGKADFSVTSLTVKKDANNYVVYTAKAGKLEVSKVVKGGLVVDPTTVITLATKLSATYDIGYEATDFATLSGNVTASGWYTNAAATPATATIVGQADVKVVIPANSTVKITLNKVAAPKISTGNAVVDNVVQGASVSGGTVQMTVAGNYSDNVYGVAADGTLMTNPTRLVIDRNMVTGYETANWVASGTSVQNIVKLQYAEKAVGTTTPGTTNPGTGANDVVGVAAALAVVALVSGAAISLKK